MNMRFHGLRIICIIELCIFKLNFEPLLRNVRKEFTEILLTFIDIN